MAQAGQAFGVEHGGDQAFDGLQGGAVEFVLAQAQHLQRHLEPGIAGVADLGAQLLAVAHGAEGRGVNPVAGAGFHVVLQRLDAVGIAMGDADVPVRGDLAAGCDLAVRSVSSPTRNPVGK